MPNKKITRGMAHTTTIKIYEDGSCEVLAGSLPYKFRDLTGNAKFPRKTAGQVRWYVKTPAQLAEDKWPIGVCVKGDVRTLPEAPGELEYFDGVCRVLGGVVV
jgi:hypothetical protein